METMRSEWTDSRLDDLNGRVTEVKEEVQGLRGEMRELGTELRGEIGEVRSEISALKRTMMQIGGGLIGTLVVGMLGLIGTQL